MPKPCPEPQQHLGVCRTVLKPGSLHCLVYCIDVVPAGQTWLCRTSQWKSSNINISLAKSKLPVLWTWILELGSFLYVEYIWTAEIGCTALQHEGLIQLPKHRLLVPFEMPQGIRDIFTELARQIWQESYRKPIPIWHGKLEAQWETLRHLKWRWTPMLRQLNWDPSNQIQKLYSFIYSKCSCAYRIYGVTFSSSTPWPHGYQPTVLAFINAFLAPRHRNPEEWTTATTNRPNTETQLSILSWVLQHILLKHID